MKKHIINLILICTILATAFTTVAFASTTSYTKTSQAEKHVRIIYDSDGNIAPSNMLSLDFGNANINAPRAAVCCKNVNKITWYDEHHVYTPPTPAWCAYDRYKLVQCTNCGIVASYEYVGQYKHVHQ